MEIKEILNKIEYDNFKGNLNYKIDRVLPLDDVSEKSNAISWCSDINIDILENIKTDSVIIIGKSVEHKLKNNIQYISVDNPRRTFQKLLETFFVEKREVGISKTAIIDPSVKIGHNVYIGHNVVIEKNCIVGDNTVILHNTVIMSNTIIKNDVVIGSNNTIGGTGFGYEKNKHGEFELIPHIGNVLIENNVDIGNNTCIDRAVLGSTSIGENVKIDNLVHIAHGVVIEKNSVVIANSMVAGSVKIGQNSWIAPSSSILNKRNIGENALVGLGAVVTKNVEDYSIVAGNPAKLLRKMNQDG